MHRHQHRCVRRRRVARRQIPAKPFPAWRGSSGCSVHVVWSAFLSLRGMQRFFLCRTTGALLDGHFVHDRRRSHLELKARHRSERVDPLGITQELQA